MVESTVMATARARKSGGGSKNKKFDNLNPEELLQGFLVFIAYEMASHIFIGNFQTISFSFT